ncbi:hypothetical protein [Cellulomonas sp. NTE-D12]|uniref:hypothetical protein n=1 Tax=Cellulomonas sp. NTE-D12 TaxID=2962632 RepID=UPI0030900937|nr:ArsR family transcriptional regulator [Cellulomonas sp. NTE-D12]
MTELARRAGVSVKAAAHEVARLVEAGLLADRRAGNLRLVRRGPETPLTRPLTDLLAVTYGAVPVLTDALSGVPGVEAAYIYGSWAARYKGEAGPVPGDVDVLVVGAADLDVLDEVARGAGRRLGREVAIHRVGSGSGAAPPANDAFLASVRTRPIVELELAAGGAA